MIVALTRPVPPSIARCELTHLSREPIDWRRADAQHRGYEALLEACGCQIRRVTAAPDEPDSVFVEDTAVVVGECAVITRPGAPSRRAETVAVADLLAEYRPLATIEAPGTIDGGDVLQLGRRVFVGLSTRTNAAGVRQLDAVLRRFGYSVQPVATRGCLHLKSAVTALGPDRLLLNPKCVDGGSLDGLNWLEVEVSEPFAANVVEVNGTVICPARATRTNELLQAHGYRLEPIDMSELAKAEGALTCCSLLVQLQG
jgi:dimethylargininase